MSRNESRAKRGVPFNDDLAAPQPGLAAVIKFYLSKYQYLNSDKRLQQLVFYTDYRYYQEYGEQLTEAEYEPSIYGLFSQDVRAGLEEIVAELDLRTSDLYVKGKKLNRYHTHSMGAPDLSDVPVEFLERMHEETIDVKTDTLVTFSRNTPAYENTPDDSTVEFSESTVDCNDGSGQGH